MKAENSFGQLSLNGLQLRQQTVVEDPQLASIQKARKNTLFDYVHRGKRIELAMEGTAASGKESSLSSLYVVIYPLIAGEAGRQPCTKTSNRVVSGICSCPASV